MEVVAPDGRLLLQHDLAQGGEPRQRSGLHRPVRHAQRRVALPRLLLALLQPRARCLGHNAERVGPDLGDTVA